MAKIDFENFKFKTDEEIIRIIFAKNYYFEINIEDLKNIDTDVVIKENYLDFPNISETKAEHKINRIIDIGLQNLTNNITGKKVLFIDEQSDIPLIGSSEFGIVDRNTNIIEVKPLTGCNLHCVYCSVNEGDNNTKNGTRKIIDLLVDPYYLATECAKVAKDKNHDIEFNINPQGEPLLYPFLEDLISALKEISNCKVISINTNATLLTKKKIDSLIEAGLTRLNISLNTLDKETANKLSGKAYNVDYVIKMIEYAQSKNLPVLIAPVIVPTFNDDNDRDIEPLIKLAVGLKSDYPKIGFQKFLCNKGGRNPVSEIPFEEFFENLKQFEEKYNLILTPRKDYNPFDIYEDKTLEKPFSKNQTVKVEIIGPSRNLGEVLAKANGRIVTVRGANKTKGSLNVKIVREKANIFIGIPLGF